MATTGGTEEKGEVGGEMGLSRRQGWPTRAFTPPGGTQRLGSGLGAPALFTAETALFGPLGGPTGRKTALFEENGAILGPGGALGGTAGDALTLVC